MHSTQEIPKKNLSGSFLYFLFYPSRFLLSIGRLLSFLFQYFCMFFKSSDLFLDLSTDQNTKKNLFIRNWARYWINRFAGIKLPYAKCTEWIRSFAMSGLEIKDFVLAQTEKEHIWHTHTLEYKIYYMNMTYFQLTRAQNVLSNCCHTHIYIRARTSSHLCVQLGNKYNTIIII